MHIIKKMGVSFLMQYRTDITDPLVIDTCDLYITMIYFLEAYNKGAKSEDISGLISELEQSHVTQWAFKEWQNSLKRTLIKLGGVSNTDSEMHDMSGTSRWQCK